MARLLPGVYSAINDLSQMPEGAQSLNVGYVVKANRGPVGEFNLVTSPTDFLTKYTFSGQPSLTDDPTMHEIIKVLAQTNTMYVSRATNNPLYGGAIVKKAQKHGSVLAVDQSTETFILKVSKDEAKKEEAPKVGDAIVLSGTGLFDSYYIVKEIASEGTIGNFNIYAVTVTGDDPIKFEASTIDVAVASSEDNSFTVIGDYVEDVKKGDVITVSGTNSNNGYYIVSQVVLMEVTENNETITKTKIKINTEAAGDIYKKVVANDTKGEIFFNKFDGSRVFRTPVRAFSTIKLGDVYAIDASEIMDEETGTGVFNKRIILNGKVDSKFSAGDKIEVKGSPKIKVEDLLLENDGKYTVVDAEYDIEQNKTIVKVEEKLKVSFNPADFQELKSVTEEPEQAVEGDLYYNEAEDKLFEREEDTWVEVTPEGFYSFGNAYYEGINGKLVMLASLGAVYFDSIVNPEAAANALREDDLFLITGIDPGAYNGLEAFSIVSAFDNPDELVYVKGAEGLFPEPCPFDTMELTVYNAETNAPLESFTFSRDENARTIDGISLFINDVVEGSAYIKVFNNPNNTDMPNSTLAGSPIQASGGSDGDTKTPADLVRALGVFEDKTIPVSIMGNGCSPEAESEIFQQALLALANTRKDMFVFLNSPASKEKATIASTRAQDIVNYKKNNLASTSFYGCMYAPHVTSPDVFNSRNVKIGAGSVATAGWLNVINSLNYPYAYAGPRNGLVTGVTCDWKIGDMSGEAEMLNDASINYVAYDGRVGRYYMQCQNTLQVANSAMRNIGVVLNVLDIKETLVTYLKEFLNLPITDTLRRDIMDTVGDYLSPMVGSRFYNYVFQDTTTDADLAQDTLRYLLTLSPSRYANRIYLVMNVVRTGFDFSILQSV